MAERTLFVVILYTLWQDNGEDIPYLIDSVDEYTLDELNGYPEEYDKKRKQPGVRELLIKFPDKEVLKLFIPPTVGGKAVEP